jgi:hypothetical protein
MKTWREETGAAWLTTSEGESWRPWTVTVPPPPSLCIAGVTEYVLVENDDPLYYTYIEVPDDDRG